MKTIEQWLNELPEPYRSQALENAKIHKISDNTLGKECEGIDDALWKAFIWSWTPQGHEYWDSLSDSLSNNLPPH